MSELHNGGNPMKVYLAARYSRRDQLNELAAELRRMGHIVTSRWLETEWVNRPDQNSAAPPEYRQKYALIDLEDVRRADAVVSFTEAPGDGSRGGRHVEFGYGCTVCEADDDRCYYGMRYRVRNILRGAWEWMTFRVSRRCCQCKRRLWPWRRIPGDWCSERCREEWMPF